ICPAPDTRILAEQLLLNLRTTGQPPGHTLSRWVGPVEDAAIKLGCPRWIVGGPGRLPFRSGWRCAGLNTGQVTTLWLSREHPAARAHRPARFGTVGDGWNV